jgi:hypothetical protein
MGQIIWVLGERQIRGLEAGNLEVRKPEAGAKNIPHSCRGLPPHKIGGAVARPGSERRATSQLGRVG